MRPVQFTPSASKALSRLPEQVGLSILSNISEAVEMFDCGRCDKIKPFCKGRRGGANRKDQFRIECTKHRAFVTINRTHVTVLRIVRRTENTYRKPD